MVTIGYLVNAMPKKYRAISFYAILTLAVLCLCLAQSIRMKYEAVSALAVADKKVAITFDDGPHPDYTAYLLEGLKERGVSATFFLLGKEAEKYPELVIRMYEEGHLVATHAYEHVNLCNLSDEEACAQIEKTNTLIEKLTGCRPQFLRPPFGCFKEGLDCDTEMIKVLWSIDPLDWNCNNSAEIARRVLKEVKDGDIILLHDASKSSVNAAFAIIDTLKKEGYCFVTVEELVLN